MRGKARMRRLAAGLTGPEFEEYKTKLLGTAAE